MNFFEYSNDCGLTYILSKYQTIVKLKQTLKS